MSDDKDLEKNEQVEQNTVEADSQIESEIQSENENHTEAEPKIEADTQKKEEVQDKAEVKSESGEKRQFGVNFQNGYNKLQSNLPLLIGTCIAAFLVMVLSATAFFFMNIKGPEQVLVPNVVGQKLEDALIEMQLKELYPKITMRYSESFGDEGTILEQSPEAGAIVRGYSRVSLVVSRGLVEDKVGNYVGMNLDELRLEIQTKFAGRTALIVLAEPEYKPDTSEAGTILEQDPPEGTDISQPVTVQLIVSRGPNYDNTRTPKIIGQSINDVLQTIARSKIVFEFTARPVQEGEIPGTIVSQEYMDENGKTNPEFVPNYSRLHAEIAMPKSMVDDNVYGIFQENLSEYPYPVPMRLDAIPHEGNPYTILNFSHTGGNLTLPYSVPEGTTLVLYVVDKVVSRKVITKNE